ncbi:PUA-like protein [Gonapodya prolifera JEL478]|uniref:PUA-like protein n=1 Tax=Gonapodya prolifera (strain JEL478) TaxID=1344416 RepID=A0A139AXS3_GONPJ|nr:PUA-like protein [Gonapodya prolifera JEL478]|eukprot:KXS21504.1 PUA-like protein [Gonapodya prolifera JEL478]
MWGTIDGLRVIEVGSTGQFRDELNALILEGKKTATAGLYALDYETECEAVETVGERLALVDNDKKKIAVIEITRVERLSFDQVSWEFAEAEGEGFTDIVDWRNQHRGFWSRCGHNVTPDSQIVCLWFKVVERTASKGAEN